MSEIEILLRELQNMKSTQTKIKNTSEIWSMIGSGKWEEAGFSSKDEADQWLKDNEYSNLA